MIPNAELLQPRSYINAYVNKVVSKRFTFPMNGIGLLIGKEHVNIKRAQEEYKLKSLYFDKGNMLIAVAPKSDYDWTWVEGMIEKARQRKYKTKEQLMAKKSARK